MPRCLLTSVCLLSLIVVLGACSSQWREAYVGMPRGSFEERDAAELRVVPWSRVSATLDAIERGRAARDTYVGEWTAGEREDEHAELLRGLQVSEDPATVTVLGRSVFRSTDRLSPSDTRLRRFARRLGADLVVVSSVYTGKAERVQHETVTVHRDRYVGSSRHRHKHHGKHRRGHYEPTRETYTVPVVVEADEHAWAVYYLRRSTWHEPYHGTK